MPQIFKVGSYLVYFWANENKPLEPIHVHISKGVPVANATKIWITKTGKGLISHNDSRIPNKTLNTIKEIIEARSGEIIEKWYSVFGEITYYC